LIELAIVTDITTKPRVSTIIPTYNCDRYIKQAVDSVLAQKEIDCEIIIIDDGSSDRTEEIMAEYDDRVIYMRQANQGVAAARNKGIELARGEFIAFLDADDYFLPNKLALQVAVFDDRPSLGIVHSGWQKVDADGNKQMDVRPWKSYPELNLEAWLRWKPILPSAMMFRCEWLQAVNGFDPRFPPAEDVDLILRLALKGCTATWLRRVTVCYRQHADSAMFKGLPQARSLTKVLDNFFSQPDLPESVQLLEDHVRYSTMLWLAWYLHSTGHQEEMVEYLQKSWQYRPFMSIETVTNWAESFGHFYRDLQRDFDIAELTNSPPWRKLMDWAITETIVASKQKSISNNQ
jgi:glycosyltransferase involved in cell wall biosynthesis